MAARIRLVVQPRTGFLDEIQRIARDTVGSELLPVFRRGQERNTLRPARSRGLGGDRLSAPLHLVLSAPEVQRLSEALEAAGVCERVQHAAAARPAVARSHFPRIEFAEPREMQAPRGLMSAAPRDLSRAQRYLGSAPNGLGIEDAWAMTQARGETVRLVDIEWGWNLSHEDLRRRTGGLIHGRLRDDDHGTAVLGILSGDHNSVGIKGISPESMVHPASGDDDEDGVWNPEAAIEAAMDFLDPGDVIVLEMHVPGPRHPGGDAEYGLVPVEYVFSAFLAICSAVDAGIHVVQAAGNGAVSLDDPALDDSFDRSVQDSGAILVGAGQASTSRRPRARLPFSNWGTRIDVQAWGEKVATTGGSSEPRYWDLYPGGETAPDPERAYTGSFSGTSSAAAIIGGTVALIVSACRLAGRIPPDPRSLRALLVETGSEQPDADEHIGPLPNVTAVLKRLGVI